MPLAQIRRLVFTGLLVLGVSQGAGAEGISGSAHDFSELNWNTGQRLCTVCHADHSANQQLPDSPLWNRAVTSAVFTVYASVSLDAAVGQPDGHSKLCLSCHDGTVALDNYGGGTTFAQSLGEDLRNDHPVSFIYDSSLAARDSGLRDPNFASSGLGGTITEDLLVSGRLECSSCHDVHNSANTGALLVKSNHGSALCLTCHAK